MKKALIISFLAIGLTACGGQTQPASQTANSSNISARRSNDSLVVSSHSTENVPTSKPANSASPNSASPNPSPSKSSPMARAIDVSQMTARIEQAEKNYKSKSADAKAKEELADAYFARAFALTEAAQYRAALGDFRKGLNLKPGDEDARKMHDQIIDIFRSIGREPPKEGKEPPPMPFKKDA